MTPEQAQQAVARAIKSAKELEAVYPGIPLAAQITGMQLMTLSLMNELPSDKESLIQASDALIKAFEQAATEAAGQPALPVA